MVKASPFSFHELVWSGQPRPLALILIVVIVI